MQQLLILPNIDCSKGYLDYLDISYMSLCVIYRAAEIND